MKEENIWKIVYAAVIFIILDLGFMHLNRELYTRAIINVQRVMVTMRYSSIFVVYLLLIGVLYWFILRTRRPVWEAVILGLVINGVYEFTNYSLLKKWDLLFACIDTLWGGVLFGLTTYGVYSLL